VSERLGQQAIDGRRALILVLDGVGCGTAPDTREYGDEGSDTLGNVARSVGGLNLPNLQRLGLGNIASIEGVAPLADAAGAWGTMLPRSAGKDSTTGHWEIAGLHLDRPFPTYPAGFPPEVLSAFSAATGRAVIANTVASGTAVIADFAEDQRRTGAWIVYTSADSVFQVAAHEEWIPLEELYRACEIAREPTGRPARRVPSHRSSLRGNSGLLAAYRQSPRLLHPASGSHAARCAGRGGGGAGRRR
jgi:phosphopentomutase